MVGLWAWNYNSDFKVQIDGSGTGRVQNCSCDAGCWPNGTVYFQNISPSYYASTYTFYSGQVFNASSSTNCLDKSYTGARYTLSSDGIHMKVEWLQGGKITGHSENYTKQ